MKKQVGGNAHRLAATVLIVSSIVIPSTASAQAAAAIPLVLSVGAWVVEKIADHYVGKALDSTDEALGQKHKENLTAARNKLQENSAPTAEDRAAIKSLTDQISLLNKLISQQQADPRVLQAQTKADLDNVQKSLSVRDDPQLRSIVGKLQVALEKAPSGPRSPEPASQPPPSPIEVKPSFDCTRASTFVEKEVCGNARLASVDAELGRVYWAARNRMPKADGDRLRTEELAWLRQRDYLLRTVCMSPTGHLDTDCAIFFWNQRIAELPRV